MRALTPTEEKDVTTIYEAHVPPHINRGVVMAHQLDPSPMGDGTSTVEQAACLYCAETPSESERTAVLQQRKLIRARACCCSVGQKV